MIIRKTLIKKRITVRLFCYKFKNFARTVKKEKVLKYFHLSKTTKIFPLLLQSLCFLSATTKIAHLHIAENKNKEKKGESTANNSSNSNHLPDNPKEEGKSWLYFYFNTLLLLLRLLQRTLILSHQ